MSDTNPTKPFLTSRELELAALDIQINSTYNRTLFAVAVMCLAFGGSGLSLALSIIEILRGVSDFWPIYWSALAMGAGLWSAVECMGSNLTHRTLVARRYSSK